MIERLVTTARALADAPLSALDGAEGARLVDDCADAVRLALDCPQQDLTLAQRASLRRLADALDAAGHAPGDVRDAAAEACAALGLAPPRGGEHGAR